MQKIATIFVVSAIIFTANFSQVLAQVKSYPKNNHQERMERRSGAYKKSLGQAVAEKNPEESLCYYEMSGCDKTVLSKNNSLISKERLPLQYPKQGYLLGSDGLYHFKSSAMSRN